MSSLSLDSNDMPLLQEDNSNGHWFDRSLEIKGLEIVVAGAVGGQSAVPDQWTFNQLVARSNRARPTIFSH